MDEGQVKIERRHLVLQALSSVENKQWKDIKKQLQTEGLVEEANIQRIWDLIKVRGSISKIEE